VRIEPEIDSSHGGRPERDTALRQLLRPLAPFLAQADVTEIAINRPGELWTREARGWERHELPVLSTEHLQALTTAMAVFNGLPLRSMVSVVLPGGERGQIVRPPACIEGMAPVTIRKHAPIVRSLEELDAEGTFAETRDVSFHQPSAEVATREGERQDLRRVELFELELLGLKRRRALAQFLRAAVQHKRNIVIAGKTGSGKTTLARSICEEVPATERIVTIEDVHELALPNHPNRIHLMFGEGEGRVSADSCLAACMRLSPDRIFLAELRGSEAWEYVLGLNTGHPGSVTTTHANGAVQAFERVASLIKNSEVGRGLEVTEIRRVLHTTLDVVLFMAERKVTEIFYDPIFAKERMS
jgi:type IV secretion system protein VirB11